MQNPQGPGLIKGKPLIVIAAAGGPSLGTPYDYLTPYVNQIFSFIGFNDIKWINVNNSTKPESKELGIKESISLLPKFEYDAGFQPAQLSYPAFNRTDSFDNGNKVLYITSSPMGANSASNTAVKDFIGQYKQRYPDATFDQIDLANDNIQPFTASRVQAKFSFYTNAELTQQAAEEWNYTKELIAKFKEYDTYVFGVPTWNNTVPN